MKDWKEVPHLFANGKFKVKVENFDNPVPFTPYWLREITREEPMPKCTLIARRIEDMTDGELENCQGLWNEVVYYPTENSKAISAKDALVRRSRQGDFSVIMHLLSIGVYPFDQGHFETGEVLDEKEVV